MADFNKPSLSSLYSVFPDEIRAAVAALAQWLEGTTDTGLPDGAKRWEPLGSKWERWTSGAWTDLCTLYEINVRSLGGKTVDDIYADLAPAGYVPDGMLTDTDLEPYYTAAQVDVIVAGIPTGSDGTDHVHDQYVSLATLTSYVTVGDYTVVIDGLDTRITALEGGNYDDRYYTKTEADGRYQPAGDYPTTDDLYTKSEVYTKGEVDSKILDGEESFTASLSEKFNKTDSLSDISDVTGAANTVLGFDGDGAVIERPVADVSGAKTFQELTDCPDSYTDQAGKIVVVKSTEDGLEFVDIEESWSTVSDEQQFYGTSWNLNGGTWSWRLQNGQYQFRGAVSRPNTTSGWWQLTTTGNVSIPEANGQVVQVVAYKSDGIPVASAAKFVSDTRIDLYIPDDSASEWWFDFSGIVLAA